MTVAASFSHLEQEEMFLLCPGDAFVCPTNLISLSLSLRNAYG